MNANILDFFTTEEISYASNTQPGNSFHSIFPRIFQRVLDILSCDQLAVYKELQAAFVAPVTNFLFTYDDGLLNPALRAQVAESIKGLIENRGALKLKIIATDAPEIEGMWALVPRCRRFTINGDHTSRVCAETDGIWNHQTNPTIFVNTKLDLLLDKTNISEEERLHLLLMGFSIAIHELGHFLHRYVRFCFYVQILFIKRYVDPLSCLTRYA